MTPTAEPIETGTVLVSALWVALVLVLLVRWCAVWPHVDRMPRPASMRLLVLIRLIGYSAALLVAMIVLASGMLQASSPRPPSPSPWREFFQVGWLVIACSQVTVIGVIEWLTRRVIRMMENDA